ncbi:MAG: hypothetical protein L0207_06255 [Chlamydiae bacterium]|nr:hypothetical protein [Chlamydiota bacterium]
MDSVNPIDPLPKKKGPFYSKKPTELFHEKFDLFSEELMEIRPISFPVEKRDLIRFLKDLKVAIEKIEEVPQEKIHKIAQSLERSFASLDSSEVGSELKKEFKQLCKLFSELIIQISNKAKKKAQNQLELLKKMIGS